MSFYFLLIIAVLVLGSLSLNWKQRWLDWQQGAATAPENSQAVGGVTTGAAALAAPIRERMTQEFTSIRNRLPFTARQPDLAQRFREWATAALAQDENTSSWLKALSAEANIAFTQQVAEFCTEMGFELSALLDGQLNQLPTTEQKAREIVLHYCRANRQAAVAQHDFDAFKRYLAYLRAPSQKANQLFGQSLYVKLVQQEVAPPPPFDIMLASEADRRAHIVTAIRQAAAQQPAAFHAALQEVITEGNKNLGKERVTGYASAQLQR